MALPTRYRAAAIHPFGPATAGVIEHYQIDTSIHQNLKEIVDTYVQKEWLGAVIGLLEEDPPTAAVIAQSLVNAMKRDVAGF